MSEGKRVERIRVHTWKDGYLGSQPKTCLVKELSQILPRGPSSLLNLGITAAESNPEARYALQISALDTGSSSEARYVEPIAYIVGRKDYIM